MKKETAVVTLPDEGQLQIVPHGSPPLTDDERGLLERIFAFVFMELPKHCGLSPSSLFKSPAKFTNIGGGTSWELTFPRTTRDKQPVLNITFSPGEPKLFVADMDKINVYEISVLWPESDFSRKSR